MGRGSGGGVRLLVDMWKTPHRAAGCAAMWTAVIGAVCAGPRAVPLGN